MPNGGSDCCGTCWFNKANEGQPGYNRKSDSVFDESYCVIRDFKILIPFYTYCANHPHHNPQKIPFPVGSSFVDHDGRGRKILSEIPDSEDYRLMLLNLIKDIREVSNPVYPIGVNIERALIYELRKFKELRVIPDLKRILKFNFLLVSNENYDFGNNLVFLMGSALETLAYLIQDEALSEIHNILELVLNAYESFNEPRSLLDFQSLILKALGHCKSEESDAFREKIKKNDEKFLIYFNGQILDIRTTFTLSGGNSKFDLPSNIGKFVHLNYINATLKNQTFLPESIGKLTKLEYLYLRGRIIKLPNTIGDLVNLKTLIFSDHKLKVLPNTIGNLTSLKELHLTGNRIEILPESIGSLTNLEYLFLRNNRLKTLPHSIGNLISLKKLVLTDNKIKELPETIENLFNLEELYLENNNMKNLPKSINNLVNLKEISLDKKIRHDFNFKSQKKLIVKIK